LQSRPSSESGAVSMLPDWVSTTLDWPGMRHCSHTSWEVLPWTIIDKFPPGFSIH
jgi:hypothetical protein